MSTRARTVGTVAQGVVLGVFLFLVIVEFMLRVGGTSAFRYQGF